MDASELTALNIIANVGTARSNYILAIDKASEKEFKEAEKLMQEAEAAYNEGHKAHSELLTKMASGEEVTMTLLLPHAEDQLMSAEAFGILAQKFIALYKKLEED